MKTFVTLALIIISITALAQPVPEKAPVDPNYSITDAEMDEMKQNGIILPPIKPAIDPWAKYQYKGPLDFPIVYDMRQTPWLTPIKSQSGGACWAYSTMGAVESRWLMLGLGEYNLSDNNLKYCHLYVPERSTWGNHWMASAYFARRSGPFLETEDPYPGGTSGPDDCPTNLNPVKYITDSRYPPSQNMNAIKQTVMETGLVWSLLYYSDTWYNSTNKTYFYGGTHEVNHAGCVIGWNDTLQTAGGTGAWIVRNTYGQGWGEGGYYYISYNDSQFTKYNGFWPNVMENEPNTTIYQYDEIGGYWGVGFNIEVGYGLVKFEGIAQDTRITKIGTFLVSYGCGVEIKIYDEFNTVLSGLLCSKDEVICELPGYYTFDLDSSIVIPAGEDFYVQIKYDSNDPTDKWPIAIEDTISGYSQPEIETGNFWIAPNPEIWPTYWYQVGHNTPYHYDLCIKAYAENIYYPTVAITSPVAEEKFCNPEIQVSGTADDINGNLSIVEVRLNGGWLTAAGTENWTLTLNLSPGINIIEARAKDATDYFSTFDSVEVIFSVQTVPLIAGWSVISAFLDPDNPNVVTLMQNVAANMVLMLGTNGIYALPPFNINTLINWNVYDGYKIKMNAPDNLTFCGDALTDNSITLGAGFHIIPVLTNQISPVDEIFDDPQDDILYILDLATGMVYWPGGGIHSLTELIPGSGYMANFINPVTITYPGYNSYLFDQSFKPNNPQTCPWPYKPNFNVHLISIEKKAFVDTEADYIGAFDDENHCIGFTKMNETSENILLMVYGDDEFTEEKDGPAEGEIIKLKSFNSQNKSEEILHATFDSQMPQHDGTFAINGLSKITGFFKTSNGSQELLTNEIIQVFPQPANKEVTILFPYNEKPVMFEMISTDGKVLKTGWIRDDQTHFDLKNIAPGFYILQFRGDGILISKRLIIE